MDFIKLFSQYRIPYDSTGIKRGWVNITCPWCADKSMNGGFNAYGSYFYCWRCGSHGLEQTLSRTLSMPLSGVREIIKEYDSRTVLAGALNNRKQTTKKKQIQLPGSGFTKVEYKYLTGRRFNPRHLAEYYGIVGGGVSGEWKFRIIIPLFISGRLVSWTARSILSSEQLKKSKQPRYKQLRVEESIVDPKRILYNIDHCHNNRLVLLEGAFDVIRMGDGFACSFGTELTQAQVKYIRDNFSWVGILFDAEKEAQVKARKYALQLSALGINTEVIDAFGDYGKKDAGELSPRQARELREALGFF